MKEENYKRLSEEIKQNPPLYRIGDVVVVHSEGDIQKAIQGKVKIAEFFREWFYSVEVEDVTGKKALIHTYEKNTGDAKTKIINFK